MRAINVYNNAIKSGISFEKALATARRTTNRETVALIESSKGLEISPEKISAMQKASTLASKAQSAAFNVLSTAGNMILFTVAAKGIELATTAISNWIHRTEIARERTAKLFDEFKEMNDTLSIHKKTVSELSDRYDKLAKGFNFSTKKSSLSPDEYEEFLDINKQLAESFPSLASITDENGNSLLTLGKNGSSAKEQLEELLQAEENLNNFKISEGLTDAFKGVYTYIEDASAATDKLNSLKNGTNKETGVLQDFIDNGVSLKQDNYSMFKGEMTDEAKTNYAYAIQSAARQFIDGLDDSRRIELQSANIDAHTLFTMDTNIDTGTFDFIANLYSLTPDEISNIESLIGENVSTLNGALNDRFADQNLELEEQIQKGKNAWQDFLPNLVAGMKNKATFKNLEPDLQNIAVQIVECLDYSYSDAMNEYDSDPYAYIRDKFIIPMSELNDSDKELLSSTFENLFKVDIC